MTVDLFVIEFLGLAMIAMCVVVVALPSQRKPSSQQHIRHD